MKWSKGGDVPGQGERKVKKHSCVLVFKEREGRRRFKSPSKCRFLGVCFRKKKSVGEVCGFICDVDGREGEGVLRRAGGRGIVKICVCDRRTRRKNEKDKEKGEGEKKKKKEMRDGVREKEQGWLRTCMRFFFFFLSFLLLPELFVLALFCVAPPYPFAALCSQFSYVQLCNTLYTSQDKATAPIMAGTSPLFFLSFASSLSFASFLLSLFVPLLQTINPISHCN